MKRKIIYGSGAIIGIVIVAGIGMYSWNFTNIQKPKNEGIAYLQEKNYTSALNKFNQVLTKDGDNSEVINLKELSENCIAISDEYNSNDFPSVIESYNKVKDNSNFSLVNTDIDEMYNTSKKKPSFKLKYAGYNSEQYGDNNYFEDEQGEINLLSFEKYSLDDSAYVIEQVMPNVFIFQIENIGIDPAEDVVLNFKFNNMAIDFESGGKWTGVTNNHGVGTWSEVKFNNGSEPVYKDIPIKFNFGFAKSIVYDNASIDVTISAKDCTPKKITIPVKVEYNHEPTLNDEYSKV